MLLFLRERTARGRFSRERTARGRLGEVLILSEQSPRPLALSPTRSLTLSQLALSLSRKLIVSKQIPRIHFLPYFIQFLGTTVSNNYITFLLKIFYVFGFYRSIEIGI